MVFLPVIALWLIAVDAGFVSAKEMIAGGDLLGYFMVFGSVLAAVGLWGLLQIVLKLLFPEAFEQSISFYRFHLICGVFGFLCCAVFFIVTNPSIAIVCPLPALVMVYLYRKCRKYEQLNYL